MMAQENKSWVQDEIITFANATVMKLTENNADYIKVTDSYYEIGEPKERKFSGDGRKMVGIYFVDPTSKKSAKQPTRDLKDE